MTGYDAQAVLPVSPFVRRRWRRRLGLPDDFVVRLGVERAPACDADLADAALFTCSAAIVGREHLDAALALGTPVVCDAGTASAVGAVDGTHVVVAARAAAEHTAELVAGDDSRAARLGRNARRLAVDRSPARADDGADPLDTALAGLGTPPSSPLAARLRTRAGAPAPARRSPAGSPASPRRLPDEHTARLLADAFGVVLSSPVTDLAPPSATPRSLRERLAGKSARDIAAALARRVRRR